MATADKDKKEEPYAGKVVDLATGEAVDASRPNVYVPEPARIMQVEGNDVRGFVGVDAEYMNYASDTSKPFMTDNEEALYEENQRKIAVAAGVVEPDDDDMVHLEDGYAVPYSEYKAAVRDAEDKSSSSTSPAKVTTAATPKVVEAQEAK